MREIINLKTKLATQVSTGHAVEVPALARSDYSALLTACHKAGIRSQLSLAGTTVRKGRGVDGRDYRHFISPQ